MLGRLRLLPSIGRSVFSLPDRAAHGLVVRDLDSWVRLEFLGVAVRSGIADALIPAATIDEVAERADITDLELLEAVLDLGVSLGEIGRRRGRYHARGRRLRAVAGGSPDLRGTVEALVVYDNAVYGALETHLRGAPPRPYDAECGDVIAAASRIAEPVLGPAVRAVAGAVRPSRVLDVGCGSGVYLRHALDAATTAEGVGIDLDAGAVAGAEETLADLLRADRCVVRQGDIEALAGDLGTFDLVMLLNNIYYWEPAARARALETVGSVLAPAGTLLVATATPHGQAYNRHLDIILRVTSSSSRLPTRSELDADMRRAGFVDVALTEPVPRSGLVVATGRRPA